MTRSRDAKLGGLAALVLLTACRAAGPASSPVSATGPVPPPAATIQALSSAMQAAQHATFKAVYSLTTGGGAAQTVTVAQKPPKSLFATNDALVVNDGARTDFCEQSGGAQLCVVEPGGTNPLAPLAQLFSPASALAALQHAQPQMTFSSERFAGRSATCARLNEGQKYCVTTEGILAYAGSGSGSFTMTSYSTSVPDSEFAIPGPGG